jgi:hypothetical protein
MTPFGFRSVETWSLWMVVSVIEKAETKTLGDLFEKRRETTSSISKTQPWTLGKIFIQPTKVFYRVSLLLTTKPVSI